MNENQFRTSMRTIKNYIDNNKGSGGTSGSGSTSGSVSWNDITDKPTLHSQDEVLVVTSSATTFATARTDIDSAITTMPALIYFDPTNDISYAADGVTIHVYGFCNVFVDPDGMTNYVFADKNIAIKFDNVGIAYVRTLYTPKTNLLSKTNTIEYTPTSDYHPATKKYVDDKVASVSGGSGEGSTNADTVDGYHIVKLTKVQYDALSTKDENTLYFVTE